MEQPETAGPDALKVTTLLTAWLGSGALLVLLGAPEWLAALGSALVLIGVGTAYSNLRKWHAVAIIIVSTGLVAALLLYAFGPL